MKTMNLTAVDSVQHVQHVQRARRLALAACVIALGFGSAAQAQAPAPAGAEYRVADFSRAAEAAQWAAITDKWAKGDSAIEIGIAQADRQQVLRVKSKLGTKFGYPFTSARRFFKEGGVPTDLSAYKGVRMRVRGNGEFKLQVQSAAVSDFNEFTTEVPVDRQWRVVDLPFSQFAQSPYWGKQVKWDPAALRGLVLHFDGLPGAPEVAVEVASISLYK